MVENEVAVARTFAVVRRNLTAFQEPHPSLVEEGTCRIARAELWRTTMVDHVLCGGRGNRGEKDPVL